MKNILLIALLLSPAAHAGIFSTENVKPYPSGWPALAGMLGTCAEVQGSYIDPNRQHWDYEEQPSRELGGKYGGSFEAAWRALGLPAQEVQWNKRLAMPRVFTIAMNADQTVSVKYLIDGAVVSSRSFTKSEWSCGRDGLTLTILDRTGQVLDKISNEGRTIRQATLYRMSRHIYVKSTDSTKAMVMMVFPQSFYDVSWSRFVEQRQLPTASQAADKVLRMNTAVAAFNEKYLPAKGSKAFAQGPGGAWAWAADRSSPSAAAEDAIAICARYLKKFEKPCDVVHIDDWWTGTQ